MSYCFTFKMQYPCHSRECLNCKWRKGKKPYYCDNPKRERLDALENGAILAGEIRCKLKEVSDGR